jgi:hypothetical protein
VLYRMRAGARTQGSGARWIAGSHSIEPFEVSRNGIVQLWGLKTGRTCKIRAGASTGDQPGLTSGGISRGKRTVTSIVI